MKNTVFYALGFIISVVLSTIIFDGTFMLNVIATIVIFIMLLLVWFVSPIGGLIRLLFKKKKKK